MMGIEVGQSMTLWRRKDSVMVTRGMGGTMDATLMTTWNS